MGLLAVLKSVGSAILATVVPSLGTKLVEKVNDYLEPDSKLDAEKATGEEVAKAVEGLPPETQALIIQSEVAKEIAQIQAGSHYDDNSVKIQLALIEAEKKGSKTRPLVVAAMTLLVVAGLGTAIWTQGYIVYSVMKAVQGDNLIAATAEITAIKSLLPDATVWTVILGFPIWCIRSYFGDRSEDKRVRANAQVGVPTEPKKTLGGAVGDVISKKIFKLG